MPKKTIPDDFSVFPKRLKQLMHERKVIKNGKELPTSQQELAEKLTVKRQTVSLYLTGQSVPDAIQIRSIAQFFNVSTDWLLGLTDIRTVNSSERAVCDYTGLTEETVTVLHAYLDAGSISNFLKRYLEDIVASSGFRVEAACVDVSSAAHALAVASKPVPEVTIDNIIDSLNGAHEGTFRIPASEAAAYYTSKAQAVLKRGIDEIIDEMVNEQAESLAKGGLISETQGLRAWRLFGDENADNASN